MEALAGLRRCDGIRMYNLQSIAKPSLANTFMALGNLSGLTSKAILPLSPLMPKERGEGGCQVSSYLEVRVSFCVCLFLKSKEMGPRWTSLPTTGCFHKEETWTKTVSAQTTVFSRKALDLSECKVATRGQGNVLDRRDYIAVLFKDFSNSVTRYTPSFSEACW